MAFSGDIVIDGVDWKASKGPRALAVYTAAEWKRLEEAPIGGPLHLAPQSSRFPAILAATRREAAKQFGWDSEVQPLKLWLIRWRGHQNLSLSTSRWGIVPGISMGTLLTGIGDRGEIVKEYEVPPTSEWTLYDRGIETRIADGIVIRFPFYGVQDVAYNAYVLAPMLGPGGSNASPSWVFVEHQNLDETRRDRILSRKRWDETFEEAEVRLQHLGLLA
jgi:hypothetical protein